MYSTFIFFDRDFTLGLWYLPGKLSIMGRSAALHQHMASWDPMAPWKVPAIKFGHTLVGSFVRGYN